MTLPPDPWGLTPPERAVVAALAEVGDHKRVCRTVGLAKQTVKKHLNSAAKRMGLTTGAGMSLRLALAWDRWVRSNQTRAAICSAVSR
jgi:DNA-binding NarL/FixJ family response regulator